MAPLSALLLLLATSTPGPHCFVPTDQTAGWKRVTLPEEAPALAAPEELDQFRSAEPARFLEQDNTTSMGAIEEHPGRRTFEFSLPPDTRRLDLEFFQGLDGAKVDAEVHAGGVVVPLLSEWRLGGSWLALEWQVPGASLVRVSVHHHLRSRPQVRSWRVTRVLNPGEQPRVADFFRAPHSLYFFHPGGGRRVELCDAPGRPLSLRHWPEASGALQVSLSPR